MKSQPSKADLNRSREHVNNIVAEVAKAVNAKVKPDDFDTALVRKINATCQECFYAFKRMHDLNTVPMKKMDAIEHIRRLYKDKCATWSKDELLEAFCLVQATLGVEAFHEELV